MGVSGERQAPAALPPGKEPQVPIGQEAGWSSEPAGLDTEARGKSSYLFRGSNLDHLVVHFIDTVLTELPGSFHDYKVWLFEFFL
jgi:hypothetical protein